MTPTISQVRKRGLWLQGCPPCEWHCIPSLRLSTGLAYTEASAKHSRARLCRSLLLRNLVEGSCGLHTELTTLFILSLTHQIPQVLKNLLIPPLFIRNGFQSSGLPQTPSPQPSTYRLAPSSLTVPDHNPEQIRFNQALECTTHCSLA